MKSYTEMVKETDLLVVTGDIGAAYGLKVLEREKQVFQVNPNCNQT
jgi:thiamine-monophosphate kinase